MSSSSDREVVILPPTLPNPAIATSCPSIASVCLPVCSFPCQLAQAHASYPPKPVASPSSARKPPISCGGRVFSLQAALSPPSSDSVPQPGCKLFVDLFAGASAPLSAAIAALGLARLEPLDKLHGCGFDLLDDVQLSRLCALACSGIVGAAAAAPPCAPFSRARLRPGGPKPVRTPDFPTGIPDPSPAQQSELSTSALLHERARHFLSLVAAHGGLIILENPSSSILWLDPAVRSWLAVHAPYCAHVAACQYGLALPKAWAFWANFSVLGFVACKCPHPPIFHPPFAGRRNADGSFATRQTACYPDALAAAIAAQIAADCRHPVFCPACLLTLFLPARSLRCPSLPLSHFWPTFGLFYVSRTTHMGQTPAH